MSFWRFIGKSLLYHWRINLAVALGVMAATAVLTGALLVGDSVRGSLLHLTLDRLGRTDELLLTDRFFRTQLARELAGSEGFQDFFAWAVPVILFPSGTVEHRSAQGGTNRSSDVLVLGCEPNFWQLGRPAGRPEKLPGPGQIVLNEPLAEDLGISLEKFRAGGDVRVTLRFPRDQALPADLSFGKKEGLVSSLPQLKVVDIIPAASLGRFSLRASQTMPRCAYVSIGSLQDALKKRGKANAILVAGNSEAVWRDHERSRQAVAALNAMLRPTFEDYGLVIKRARLAFKAPGAQHEEVIYDYYSFSSERMVLDAETDGVAARAFAADHGQPVFTYLANAIGRPAKPQDAIPFSMISAIDITPHFQPISALSGQPIQPLGDDEIVLNRWAQEDLGVEIGDAIFVKYYDPETSFGEPVERTARFRLKDVVPLTRPARPFTRRRPAVFDRRPTLVNDPDLTPSVPGVTDQESIEKWDLPFDTSGIRGQDDDYWNYYRTTPKAFISLAAGRRLWRSRFGEATSYRIPAAGLTADQLRRKFLQQAQQEGARLGFTFRAIKHEGYNASKGTTPFDGLFLALSMFIIVAALMLVSLLFRLGVEQRASEIGIVLAVGWMRRLATRALVLEGALVAAVGGLLGVVVGVGYAWLMLAGLRTIWLGAILTPFLQFYWTVRSLLVGYVSGVLVSMLTIAWSVRQTRKVSVRRLMSGQAVASPELTAGRGRRAGVAAIVLLVFAFLLAASATRLGGEAQAGAFVGGGVLLLAALLILIWIALRYGGGRAAARGGLGLVRLAARNAGRNPARSTITIGLVAFASFLIVAMSCFRLAPTEQGVAGFDLIGQSSRPLFADLNTPRGRDKLLDRAGQVLCGGTVLSLRLRPGDEASCNNLYRPQQPRVLGVPRSAIEYFDAPEVPRFVWASSGAKTDRERANPWRVLARGGAQRSDVVPVVLDQNTAMYSLQLYQGIGEQFQQQYDGRLVTFRVEGLLANSVLQGSLLIGEDDFVRLFPDISGYRYFLIKSPEGKSRRVALVLEDRLGDQGFDAVLSAQVLGRLLAVQNTYLSTFQSLGALGLLLGTLGLATVQLRSVLERRKELALLRAAGFRRGRLAQMVMLENSVLLAGGLLTGVAAALLAVLPHMIFGRASVPLAGLAAMLAVILAVGFVSGFAAVRTTLRAPLLSALRGE